MHEAVFSHNGGWLVWQFPFDGLLDIKSISEGKAIITAEALTKSEWELIFPGEEYHPICPDLQVNDQ